MDFESNTKTLKFDERYGAIVWITAKSLFKKNIGDIYEAITQVLEASEISFYGCCFGRYDLVLEFAHKSPRVASRYACEIQDAILKVSNGSFGPCCCSLTLYRKVHLPMFRPSYFKKSTNKGKRNALRAYVFLKFGPKNLEGSSNLFSTYLRDKAGVDLLWNTSTYNFILAIDGKCLHRIFSTIFEFKRQFRGVVYETSTFFAVRWDNARNTFSQDEPEIIKGVKKLIPAIVYVKLKQFSDLPLVNIPDDWLPMFGMKNFQFRRPGWLDECLFTKKRSAAEIKSAVYRLRKLNKNFISSTSTILLFPVAS